MKVGLRKTLSFLLELDGAAGFLDLLLDLFVLSFAAIRTGDRGALVDLDLAALGPLLAVLGGGPSREGDA